MQIFLYKPNESFSPSEYIRTEFDGTTLKTYFNEELVDSRTANIGNSFFIIPLGSKKVPQVKEAEMPATKGAKIAWALSFIGESKFVAEEKNFWKRYQEIAAENTLHNTMYLLNPGVYALCIADRVVDSQRVLSKPKVKLKNPVLAWISDDITDDEIDELVERFSLEREIFCPVEYLKVL